MESDGLGWSRRRLLAAVAAGGLAGCSAPQVSEQTPRRTSTRTTTRPTTERTTTAPPRVGDNYDVGVDHSGGGGGREWTAPTDAPPGSLGTEVLIENLEIPWDLSVGADGTVFVTERVGRLRVFDGTETRVVARPEGVIDAASVAPGESYEGWFVDGGEGGVLGVAAHPTYPDPPLVYVYYTAERDGETRNRVVAVDTTADAPGTEPAVVVDDIPADAVHNGGRLRFGPRNFLWITCGDAGVAANAQDPSTLGGSVLRVRPDGSPAPDNPALGPDADDRIVTYGHRNPQGVAWLPDGTPLATEHGPDGRDELNRLEPGANYGWPRVRRRGDYADAEGVHPPLANTGSDTWAPTGTLFYTGDAVPGLRNRLLIGGLWSQRLTIATLTPPGGTLPPAGDGTRFDGGYADDAYTVTTHPALHRELGRIRTVAAAPNGEIYVLTSNRDGRATDPFPRERDDVLVRLTGA